MKNIFFLFFLLFTGLFIRAQSLSGTVTDSASHQPIEGAAVYLPQHQIGAITDAKGNYKIPSLPNGTHEVEVQMLGYTTLVQQITINGDAVVNFAINISSEASKEVVITALGNATTIQRAPVPVDVVTHETLIQQASSNVIDAIAKQPGVTEITTGPGVSKPEINGLGYNRVLVLMDGERQEDFQWGDEHGVLIDPHAVYSAEIIRGPASLQYGANAVAGVISFKSQPFAENGTIQGSVQSEYQTNNGLIGNSVDIGGNTNGFVWDVRGSYEEAHCYSDPKDGYVWGTAYNQSNVRAVLGWNKKWGYSRITISSLHRQIEIPDGERDSATGQFMFDQPVNGQYNSNGSYIPGTGQWFPNRANFLSYNPNIAGYQVLDHEAVWWQNSFNLPVGKIGINVGFTESVRHEIDSGTVGNLNMTVHDIPYDINYQNEWDNGLKLTTGINGMYEFEENFPEPAFPSVGDFEIPNYHLFDAGAYAILQEDFKNLTVSGGVRYDVRTMVGQPMYLANYGADNQLVVPAGTPGAVQHFAPFNRTFSGASASVGFSYQLPKNSYIKLNLAKSYRAPAITELTANEPDPANVYKLGDPNLKAEQGYEADLGVGYKGKDFNFEVDGFVNYIQHFIFPVKLANSSGGDSVLLGDPVYKYGGSGSAIIAGVSAYFNIHPTVTKYVEIDNGFTYIYSFLPGAADSEAHVPFTPAPRLTSEVKFHIPTGHSFLTGLYVKFGLQHDWVQNNIYSALYNELPSAAYTIYNAGIGANFTNPKNHKVVCTLMVNCTNLFNLAYVDHGSRTQYFVGYNPVANASNLGPAPGVVTQTSQGIYNMGRNIGIKAIFPIGFTAGKKVPGTVPQM